MATEVEKASGVDNSKFRCEKLKGYKLTEMKAKLLENCDLNKPFSASLSILVADETYLYCCHTK